MNFTNDIIANIPVVPTKETYLILSRVLSSNITIFNGRRGGEVQRLTIRDVEEGFAGTWLPPERPRSLSDEQKNIIDQQYILYIPSKKNKEPVDIVGRLLDIK